MIDITARAACVVRRLALVLLLALALAGCVSPRALLPPLGERAPSEWSWEVEPSMAPAFDGADAFPVLLVHSHHFPSERQREEARRNPVVCLLVEGGAPVAPSALEASADMAACAGPSVDPPTGRLFVDRAGFDAAAPVGVLAFTETCGPGVQYLSGSTTRALVRMPGHDFEVELLRDGSFVVDGIGMRPGTAVKVSYLLHAGSAYDKEEVRVVFDFPGLWLKGRVGPWDPDIDGRIPPRPERGSGLVADLPLSPASMREPIERLLAATPGVVTGVQVLRFVHDGARLTEANVEFTREGAGPVVWYGAGRTGEAIRMLGNDEGHSPYVAPVPLDPFIARFADLAWARLAQTKAAPLADVRLASDATWRAPLALPPEVAPACDAEGCIFAWQEATPLAPASWARAVGATPEAAEGALTLQVVAHGEEGERVVWWGHEATSDVTDRPHSDLTPRVLWT